MEVYKAGEVSGKQLFIHELFEIQAKQQPDAPAVVFDDNTWTYDELNRQANALANQIIIQNIPAPFIGISITRSLEMIAGLLAILKAGKACLPLDPGYPVERLQQMIKDSGMQTCLVARKEFTFFHSIKPGISLLAIDEARGTEEHFKTDSPNGLAYVLYTSGSSGIPKGVCMSQSALFHLLRWQEKNSAAGRGTRTLQFAPLSFDVSFQEIFSTLTTGGTLFLVNDDLRLDPYRLMGFIESKSIHRIFLPFVALQYLSVAADAYKIFPPNLQEIITAGEQLKVTPQLKRFFSALPSCVLYNQYGPTETHVVTALKLTGDPAFWPALPSIGKPVDYVSIYILDENGYVLPPGETGEICIAGKSLAEGYLNQSGLTAEKFILWHHPEEGVLRIYKTGDLGRWLPEGNIEFLGRRDEQVKIRGYRVEPGEVEVILNQLPAVKQAVVVAREVVPGQKILVAYLVSSNGLKDTLALRHSIEKQLPDYLIPSAFVWLDEWPKTSSGKIDKKALPNPERKRPDLSVLYKAPVTKIEKEISACWANLLQLDQVGTEDHFFELGGNSLLALKTVTFLKQSHQYDLPITKLYQNPTIRGIADYLEGNEKIFAAGVQEGNQPMQTGGDVAVIAMACRFPGANTIEELWNLLQQGKETISFFSDEELDAGIPETLKNNPDYIKARGIIENAEAFDPAFFGMNPRLAELMDPQQRIFLEISWEALESGGYLPSKYSGAIGVFAGTGNNTYYLNNVQDHTDLISRIGSFQVMTANEKDYIATRTAYELNLKGPAVSVFSACSTSLLAIAEAVESIRKGQCELALAGGVAITVPIKSGQIYQEGAMYSRDGHNRTFDAEAAGTVFSDGAGVVLLKSLEAAVRDGDTIYSVIRGTGLNNDGGGKGSFTAPSAEGQAGAIRMAIRDAGIDPAQISYIEAHGTATPLGDPIEVEGLNLAFGHTEKKQYCALGSIKSNIGHCTAAAGVAGFIKTTLALHHKKIPASINFKMPNPHIHFEQSPFYINTRLKDWENPGKRIAGVSSFGVGGTNVHVILEEFNTGKPGDPEEIRDPEQTGQLICWSAKTEKSMEAYAGKLADFVIENENISMADLAFALQTTREYFNARRFLVAGNREELIRKLKSSASPQESIFLKEHPAGIVFIFPGQGSQYPNMGKELYVQEPVFRKAFDTCADLLLPIMKEDIRDIIFPAHDHPGAEQKIHNTYYTQPALFIIEYAIAQVWINRGIKPSVMIGHSIGEFVAAHLAGVYSLQDALLLVFTRGRLMSSLPTGSMLSVRYEEEKIKSLLPAEISLAAINGPAMTVVSGPEKEVLEFSRSLTAQGIANKMLQTSHAFHSAMMDPILPSFKEVAASISMYNPQIPLISTLTGKWIQENEMNQPAYWVTQLRQPVRFAGAIKTLTDKVNPVILESGPGRVLSTLIRHQGNKKPLHAVASLDGEDGKTESDSLLKATGQLWLHGIEPDWKTIQGEQKRSKIKLPAYAFEKVRCWVDPVLTNRQSGIVQSERNEAGSVSSVTAVDKNIFSHKNVSRKTELTGQLKNIFENASGIEMESVRGDMNFIEIGFDSLLLTQIALNIKREFGIPVSFRQLHETYGSLDLLAGYLDEQLSEKKLPEEHSAIQQEEPPAIRQLSKQIELLARQVALLQQGNQSSVIVQPSTAKPLSSVGLSSEEISELKKPFGATARIEKQGSALSKKQQDFLDRFILRYNQKTRLSKAYAQEHRSFMADPRVVSGFKPLTKEIVYSLVVNKSKGSRLWDIDGNEYIDALNGFGSNLLGYQPEPVTRALHQQIERGYEIGPQHELAGTVCKLICEFTGFDRAALCNTGSEAVLGAMRIARTVTGRSTIVAFSGSYHGIVDEVIVRGTKKLKSFPAAPGIMPEAVQHMLILDYGTEESLEIIKERAQDLAAVLVEPVQSRRPEFQPVDFLRALRKITEESGTALIFDEVITGFRMHPGGTQAIFGIKADLGTYGKVVAGGLPIGVIAGNKLFMDALDGGFWEYGNASAPESGVTYFAGTFVRHPLTLAASRASLEYLKASGPALQTSLNEKTAGLADALNLVCNRKGLPLYVAQFGSLWKIKFKEEIPYGELLFSLMREKGIHIWDGFPCFLTTAHEAGDVQAIADAFEASVNDLLEAGFMSSSQGLQFVPAIEPQLEILLSCLLGGDDANRSYNESVSLRFTGPFDRGALERALKEITNRHDALRSTFSEDGRQICIYREMEVKLRFEDLSGQTLKDQEEFISAFTKQNALDVFDLLNGPLFRTALFKLGEEEYYLTITVHHIICDGWSLGILLQDLGKFYTAFTKNVSPDLEPAISFSDYSIAQKKFSESAEYRKMEQYWTGQYRHSVPVLDIPTDFPRPRERTYRSHRLDFPLEPSLVADIKKMGARYSCTLVTTLMAAFEVFLQRLTGQEDIVLGIPAAGQSATGLYGLVGHCVNLLPMRSSPEGALSFSEYLKQRRTQVLDDYEHQQITFGSLLQKLNLPRDPSRVPLVPVTFNVELGLDDGVEFQGLSYELVYNPREYENFEISLNIGGSVENTELQWSYNTRLFKSSSISNMMDAFENLLRELVSDPETRIMDIQLARDRKQQAEDNSSVYPKDKSIAVLFSEQARKTPNRRALSFEKETLSYRQLDERSNQLAHYLKWKGVKKEQLVPVCMDRSMDLIIAILGILKAGGAYVPLDPEYPAERMHFMLEDTDAFLILCTRNCLPNLGNMENRLVILIDEEWKYISRESIHAPTNSNSGSDLAYVMYTSGSTGRPKGVMIENRNVVSLVKGVNYVNLEEKNVLLNTGSTSFDATSFEYWSMLLNGGELVICSEQTLLNSDLLKQEIRKKKVNMMWFTSSLLNQWVDLDMTVFEGLRTVIAGGEKLSEKHIEKLRNRYPSMEIINGYGPTENTTFSLTYSVKERQITQPIPIGLPLTNRTSYVLDHQFHLCGVGMIGELYVGGAGVGRGYLNRPDLTKEKFLPDPFSAEPDAVMYRTGDLARYLPDGNLEYHGRLDEQVKIRGFRIEPAEIESVIEQYAGVQHAVVVAREDRTAEKRLIAYLVLKGEFNRDDIVVFLQSKLPAYMVPRILIPLNRIPLTSNGKLDKKALPDPDLLPEFGNRKIRPAETENQKMLVAIWTEALHLRQISMDDNFFELGGHSLVAVRVMKMIEDKTNKRFPITTLFEAPTIEKLSRILEQGEKSDSWKSLVTIKPGGNKPPLYIVHGSGLTVLIFHALATGLDPEQPVFGLQARGLNGIDEPFDNMEKIAACYVSEILEQDPQGPYNLAGYSFGGIVAFEMARQLKAMDREVNMLAIFDTNADHSVHFDDWALRMGRKFKRQFPKFRFILRSFKKFPAETMSYQFNFLKNKLARLLAGARIIQKIPGEEEHLDHADKINRKHDIAFEKYKLTPYNGTIDLFRVKSRMYFLDDPIYLGWKPYALQGLNIHEISGDHKTFLLAPNVQELSKLLGEILNERNAGKEVKKEFVNPSSVLKAI
jgi:amino acid adenylation domain-containing protein